MAEVAELHIKIQSDGVKQAQTQLHKLTVNAKSSEAATKQLSVANRTLEALYRQQTNQIRATAAQTARLEKAVRETRQETSRSVIVNKQYGSSLELVGRRLVGMAGAYLGVTGVISLTSRYTRAVIDADRANIRIRNSLQFVTGSAEGVAREFDFIAKNSDKYGQNIQSVAKQYVQFAAAAKGTKLEGEETRRVFEGMSAASATLALDSGQVARAFLALEQMVSNGTVQMQELRQQLGDALPGAMQIAAMSMGVTTRELRKMAERGELLTEDFLPKFSRELQKTFGGDMERKTDNLTGAMNRLNNELFLMFTDDKNQVAKSFQNLIEGITETIKDPDFQNAVVKFNQLLSNLFEISAEGFKDTFSPSRYFDKLSEAMQIGVLKTELEQADTLAGKLAAARKILDVKGKYGIDVETGPIDGGTVEVGTTQAEGDPMKPFEDFERRLLSFQSSLAERAKVQKQALSFFDDPESRKELLQIQYEEQLAFIRSKEDMIENSNEKIEKLERQHAERIKEINEEIRESRIKGLTGQLGEARDFFSELGVIAQGENRKLFEINKAFALADATVKGVQAVSAAAASVPFPANLFPIAMETARAAANVATISSTQFAGNYAQGGFVGGTSYSGDNVRANVNSGEAILNASQQREFMRLANGGGGGAPQITIIDQSRGVGIEASEGIDGGVEIRIIEKAVRASEQNMTRQFQTGVGSTVKAAETSMMKRVGVKKS